MFDSLTIIFNQSNIIIRLQQICFIDFLRWSVDLLVWGNYISMCVNRIAGNETAKCACVYGIENFEANDQKITMSWKRECMYFWFLEFRIFEFRFGLFVHMYVHMFVYCTYCTVIKEKIQILLLFFNRRSFRRCW